MQPIIAPIRPNDSGPSVANLIECLLFLVERGAFKTFAAPNRPTPDELKQLAAKARQDLAQQFFGESLKLLILHFQIQQGWGESLGGVVEDKTAIRLNEVLSSLGGKSDAPDQEVFSLVNGTVTDDSGRALSKLLVRAFDRDLRSEELLGEAQTDANGKYEIRYTSAQFKRAEKATADLRIRVLTADGKTELAVSDTVFNAPPRAVIDVRIAASAFQTDSEWERYLRELTPLVENIPAHQLTDEDLQFLTSETGIDVEHLRFIRLDATWRIQQPKHKLPVAAFYGLLRQGLPTDWALLLQAGPARWRAALKQAIADRNVPSTLVQSFEEFVTTLTDLAIDQSFVPPAEDSSARAPIGVLLAASTVSRDMQRRIAGVMLAHSTDDDPQQLWKSLAEAGVPDAAVRSTRFALEAHELVTHHLPTLAVLQSSHARTFGSGADLSQLSRGQWLQVAQAVAKTGAKSLPKGFDTAESYAESLADRVELAFPTAVVAHRLAEHSEPARRDVGMFLVKNPDFDLLTTPVELFLKTAKFEKIKTAPESLVKQLGKEVRVARLAPSTNRGLHMDALLGNGFDSATKIVMAGEAAFKVRVQKISGAAASGEMFRTATQRASDITMYTLRMHDYLDLSMPVLPIPTVAPDSHLAAWVEMFGSANGCYCPPCKSVHGPAAYLMDLLEFLKKMEARHDDDAAVHHSLLDILDARRPDLRHLKLNCANAETPLPYIDLVNELLEREIAGVAATAANTPQTPEATEVVDATDDVAARLRALPEEDGAVAAEVYAPGGKLEGAVYPWQLPFDRSFLQAGIYFSLIGASPAEVLSLSAEPRDDLHRTRLGLSPRVWALLDTATSNRERVAWAWGLASSSLDQLVQFGGPNGLLLRSGLAADELFALIESPLFAGWGLYADRGADPCNIENTRLRQRVGGVDAALNPDSQAEVFDLMHRVLRLRLALNWSMAALLSAMQALGVGRIHRVINLVTLSRLVSLSKQLGVPVERLSALVLALDQSASDSPESARAQSEWLALFQLSAADHDHLIVLGLADSLAPQEPRQRLEHAEAALATITLLREAGLDPAELRYLLRHEDLVPAVFMPRVEDLQRQLDSVVAAIQNAKADLPALAALPPLPSDATDAQREQRRAEEAARAVQVEAARQELAGRRLAAATERLREITGATVIDRVITDSSIEALLSATGGRTGGVVQDFIALAESAPGSTGDEVILSLMRVLKTTRLLSLLKATADDIKAITRLTRDNDLWLDFNTLPVTGVAPGDVLLSLQNLTGLVQTSNTQDTMPTADRRLLQVIADAPDAATAAGDLESMTGWGRSIATGPDGAQALRNLARTLALPDADLTTWQKPDTYARLQTATRWLQAHRLAENTLATLIHAARLSPGTLDALQNLARSRFASNADWYKALTPAMDRLRAQQRDALLAYILHPDTHRPRWTTVDDVYAYLLIDVQMSPCQLSSRIVQAHAAIQLFVQRCLMNLEKPAEVSLGHVSDIAEWRQWAWMKNYRVWEAGRKVFLYPENWIEPDLRDVKSSFFEDLENELLQDEITPETVERTVRTYLTKLHEVARLDIRALYEETYAERGGDGKEIQRKIIHMVGRTHAVPHVHYYRKRGDDSSWTPWEKIELSIDADQLVILVHNNRTMLFWPQFKEVQVGRSDPPVTRWDVTLSWSARNERGWDAPRSGRSFVSTPSLDKQVFTVRPRQMEHELAIVLVPPTVFAHRADGVSDPGAAQEFRLDVCIGDTDSGLSLPPTSLKLPRSARLLGNKLIAPDFPTPLYLMADASGPNRYVPDDLNIILRIAPPRHSLLPTHQQDQIGLFQPFVFADRERQFLATIEFPGFSLPDVSGSFFFPLFAARYRFSAVYHPYSCVMLSALNEVGIAGLYRSPDRVDLETDYAGSRPPDRFPRQLMHEEASVFDDRYAPRMVWRDEAKSPFVYPFEEFDFNYGGAYSLYNWEVFFHVPLLLADRLSKNGRFEDAQQWFHTIFDPTDVSSHPAPQKYWRVKPLFREAAKWAPGAIESLEVMMRRLSDGDDDVETQVTAWRNDPFNPHLLARLRLVAYMKTVVQKYIENLTAWADSLFRRDTIESINEATQLYVLASEILGAAPVVLPPLQSVARSYDELTQERSVDDFSNVLVDIETCLPVSDAPSGRPERTAPGVSMLYFCIPSNSRLHELRTTIADRLFKIRHCMDIEGRTRQLALFAPPIDPALLVRARAAGLDIGAALNLALGPRASPYRFQPLLQKALEFCGEVRSFGNALLSALEKRDGEQLAQLRARHEVGILKLASLIKKQQVEEADANLEATRKSKAVSQARLDFYASRQFMNAGEISHVTNLSLAQAFETAAQAVNLAASVAHVVPNIKIGPFDPGAEFGGTNVGNALTAAGGVLGLLASELNFAANMSAIMAGHQRRADDWAFQADLARRELVQIDQQIIAAEIRLAIAEQDQRNHEQQIAQSEEAEAMLRDKFTNAQLYSWMSAQLAALHYQSYQMAFDLAKQAESAAHSEVGTDATFIQFDHWDSGKKGLLAGERLAQDLRRLELAYMQSNRRMLEITSHVSLRRLEPGALWALRSTGDCAFTLPTWLFNLDFPGHERRRIKSVSVSIPGVVGPYVGMNGILRCTQPGDIRTIATSSGQNDAGVFQLDFRDERYLPFEGINLDGNTEWTFSLPAVVRPFDYDTISDVVLHVQYTAREGGAPVVAADVIRSIPHLRLLISVRHDFPVESQQLKSGTAEVTVTLDDRLFPYFARTRVPPSTVYRLPRSATSDPTSPTLTTDADTGETRLTLHAEDAESCLVVEYALRP